MQNNKVLRVNAKSTKTSPNELLLKYHNWGTFIFKK